jgi:hypothetical protein
MTINEGFGLMFVLIGLYAAISIAIMAWLWTRK